MTWALENETVAGPVNAVAPVPVTMKEFCETLGKTVNRPSWLPVPVWALRLVFGELASVMTTGQHVTPRMALDGGYEFQFPRLEPALRSIFAGASALEART
jgi:NAD dependent epimerase/dehydratase family enzyme